MPNIQICSIFTGPVGITTKQGNHASVTFYEKHDVTGKIGFAEVTHEQAEQFLKIPSEYWKPGTRGAKPQTLTTDQIVKAALAADPAAQKAADELLDGAPKQSYAELKEEIRKELLAEMSKDMDKGKPQTPIQKAQAAKAAKRAAASAADKATDPLIDAIRLAETAEEVDAVVGDNEDPDIAAAAADRKAQIAE